MRKLPGLRRRAMGPGVGVALAILGGVAPLSSAVAGDALGDALRSYREVPGYAELEASAAAAVRGGTDAVLLAEFVARAAAERIPLPDLLGAVRRLERLGETRLPADPVASRYLQGLSKGIPFPRIEAAADALETRLADASRRIDGALGAPSDPAAERARRTAIDHAAYALGVGVPGEALDRSLRLAAAEARPLEAAQAPALAMGVLVASGVETARSWEVVRSAWESGYRGEDLERLGKALGRLSRDGQGPPADVIDQVLAQIGRREGRDRVFDGLDALVGDDGEGRHEGVGLGRGRDPARDRPSDRGHKNGAQPTDRSQDRSTHVDPPR